MVNAHLEGCTMIFYWARFRMRSKRWYLVIPIFACNLVEAVNMAEKLHVERMPRAYLVGVGIDA
jgi:hypothetical protein